MMFMSFVRPYMFMSELLSLTPLWKTQQACCHDMGANVIQRFRGKKYKRACETQFCLRSSQSTVPKVSAGEATQTMREGLDSFSTSTSNVVSRNGPKWLVFIVICTAGQGH